MIPVPLLLQSEYGIVYLEGAELVHLSLHASLRLAGDPRVTVPCDYYSMTSDDSITLSEKAAAGLVAKWHPLEHPLGSATLPQWHLLDHAKAWCQNSQLAYWQRNTNPRSRRVLDVLSADQSLVLTSMYRWDGGL